MTFLKIRMKGDLILIEVCYFYTIWSYTDELRCYLHPGLCEPLSMVTPGSQEEGKVSGARE